ncbi:hypothetical protein F4804DRAFT_348713 [Jackrogersella minutella]|nr:hypothetical protein F4804DRAFT_348713 [Jackrogersella minutella]
MEHQADRSPRIDLINEFKKTYNDNKFVMADHVNNVKGILEKAMKDKLFRAIPLTTGIKGLRPSQDLLRKRQAARIEREDLRRRMLAKGASWEKYWGRRFKGRMINDYGPFKTKENLMDALQDFGSVRVSVYFPSDIDRIVSFLEKCEQVEVLQVTRTTRDDTDMTDLRNYVEMLEQRSFSSNEESRILEESISKKDLSASYRATHVVVELRGDAVPKQDRGSHHKIEIQIGTIIMHAWSQIEHDIIFDLSENEPSDAENDILDLINGVIKAGDTALKQLAAWTSKEQVISRRKTAPAANNYILGPYLTNYYKGYLLRLKGEKTSPAWRELDQLFDILRSSGKDVSGNLRRLMEKTLDSPVLDEDIMGDDWPLYLLKKKFELESSKTARVSSDADRRQRARYLAFRVVHCINMAEYFGITEEFIDNIESALPSKLSRPSLIDFLDLLHPEHPRVDSDSEVKIVDFCEAFLDVDRLRSIVKNRRMSLRMELPLLLTEIGHVVCPTSETEFSHDEVLTTVPRVLCTILDDPERSHWIPDIFDYAELISHYPVEADDQSLPSWLYCLDVDSPENMRKRWEKRDAIEETRKLYEIYAGENRSSIIEPVRRSRCDSLEPSMVLSDSKEYYPKTWKMRLGCFAPTRIGTSTWQYVPLQPTRWTAKNIDLSQFTTQCSVETMVRSSQWVDLANRLEPKCCAVAQTRGVETKKQYSFMFGKCLFIVWNLGGKFNLMHRLPRRCMDGFLEAIEDRASSVYSNESDPVESEMEAVNYGRYLDRLNWNMSR